MTTPDELFEFPCRFPIKVMGEQHDAFAEVILAVVQQHAPETVAADIQIRESSGGRYLSLTVTVNAISREQLDAIYRALSGHEMVKVVL